MGGRTNTSRHDAVVLQRAKALGRFDPNRAWAVGVMEDAETPEASLAYAARPGGS